MKTRVHVITLLAISATLLILSTSSTFVFADPCTATLGYPVIPPQYTTSNIAIAVPVSASCTTYYGNQLYANGSAYDPSTNTGLGSASTILSSVNGGTDFNGQMQFSLPPTAQGESVQISVSIYSDQYGSPITATSEMIQVGAGVQQTITTTTTVTEGQFPYYNPYPTAYPSPYLPNQSQYYQYQPQYQGHYSPQTHYMPQFLAQNSNNTNILDYVVIIAIIAAVIIATTGLVLVARRQPTWYALPPPPPR